VSEATKTQSKVTRVTLTLEWVDGRTETANFKNPKKALVNQEVPLIELPVEPGRVVRGTDTPTFNVEIVPSEDGWTLQVGGPSAGPSAARWEAAQRAYDAVVRNLPDFTYPEARRAIAELERLLAARAGADRP
jgi:hypothetical protein